MRVIMSRPVERQMDTMFEDQAVAKFIRGPTSTTRSPVSRGWLLTVSGKKPSARIRRKRRSSSALSSRIDSTLKQ